jgi:hypothetical protein
MAAYVVTAPAVQVVVDSRVYFLERGAAVPEGVAEEVLAHLVEIDYVTEAEADAPADPEPEAVVQTVIDDLDKMTKAQLAEVAAAESIDLTGVSKNADMAAAITAAREAATKTAADQVAAMSVPAGSDSSNL